MPVRRFDGASHITTALGSCGFAFGPGTIAAIVRRSADGSATETILKAGTSATTSQYQLQLSSAGRIQLQSGSSALGVVGLNLLAADGWCLIAATKASGSVAPRIHKYVFSTGVWTHTDAATNLANSGTPATSVRFGATQAGGAFFNGDIGYAGVSNTVFSDSAIEALVASASAWDSAGFVAMWPFTQAATTDALQDTIGGADQTAITGTSVVSEDVPWPAGVTVTADSGEATATGDNVAIATGWLVAADSGGVTATGDEVALSFGVTIPVDPGEVTATGDPVPSPVGTTVLPSPGEVTATGDEVVVQVSATVVVDPGEATASGDETTPRITVVIPVDPGEATATGDTVVLITPITVLINVGAAGSGAVTATGDNVMVVIPVDPLPPIGGGGPPSTGSGGNPGTVGIYTDLGAHPGYFRIKLTSLYADSSSDGSMPQRFARTLVGLYQFEDAQVVIPLNAAREASVTISMNDPACLHVLPYRTMLHIVYVTPTSAHLVFWGPLTQPQWSSERETVTLNALDPSVRLQHHYIRIGDQILNTPTHSLNPNPYGAGYVPFDYTGLQMLRDCGNVSGPIPALGIGDGTNGSRDYPTNTKQKAQYARGAEVWTTWLEVIGHQAAPDFELEPYDQEQGVYCLLNTFDRQGNDNAKLITLHDGFGKDNCRIDYNPGGKILNFAHVLSQGDKRRVTVADADSAHLYGAYIHWDATEYKGASNDPLIEKGKQIVAAYAQPPDYFSAAINIDADMHFKDDFYTGDSLTVGIKRGYLQRAMEGRIVKTTLKQIDMAGNVVPEIEALVTVGEGVEAGDE